MYNSIYPVKIHYRKPTQNQIVKPKEENENSSSLAHSKEALQEENLQNNNTTPSRNYSYQNFSGRTTFPNGTSSSIDYNKNKVNISQIITDFKNTTSAIGTPEEIANQVNNYLGIIEAQATKEAPNVKLIQSNLKAASQILDEYIAESLNKPSKVVENWVDALFLQNVDYKADPTAQNPDYRVNIPENRQHKIAQESETEKQVQAEIVNEEKTNTAKAETQKLFLKGKKLAKAENSKQALESFRTALDLAKENEDEHIQSLIYYETANIYAANDDLTKALENYNQATLTAKDENIKARAHISMAEIYNKTDYFAPAMEHYYDAISFAGEKENLKIQTKALLDVGNMYAQKYDKKGSFEYLDLAKNIARETQNDKVIAKAYQKTAQACDTLNENHLALDNLKYSTFHYKQTESTAQIAKNYEAAADLMKKLGNGVKAKSLLNKAYKQYQIAGDSNGAKAVFEKIQAAV